MSLKKQIETLKNHWLILLVLLVLLFMSSGDVDMFEGTMESFDGGYRSEGMPLALKSFAPSMGGDFAPEVVERKITKNANLNTEVETGTYKQSEDRLKSIIQSSEAILLNENVKKYKTGYKEYYRGTYQIKVDVEKYDSVIAQLKGIGEVQSFSETANDITAQHENTQIRLETEKARLDRYRKLYAESTRIEDKIQLDDRIFNQERTVKYLEDSLANIDKRVSYSTVHVSITEKRSEYADVVFVKLSQLIRSFVESVNSVLDFMFWLVPWAFFAWIGRVIYMKLKKRKYI